MQAKNTNKQFQNVTLDGFWRSWGEISPVARLNDSLWFILKGVGV